MSEIDIATSTRFGDAPLLVFCDHASNALPGNLDCLGLPGDILQTHIAWDIGAGALTTALAEKLNATAFCCGFSRLIVDPNRAPTASWAHWKPGPGPLGYSGARTRKTRIERGMNSYKQKV